MTSNGVKGGDDSQRGRSENVKPRPARLCYVDDSRTSAYVVKRMLKPYGYSVDHFESAEPALLALVKVQYDLLLTDLKVSPKGMDGDDLVRALRSSKDDKIKKLPVIVITGASDSEVLSQVYDAGANHIMTKPVNGDELDANIRKLIFAYSNNTVTDSSDTTDEQIPILHSGLSLDGARHAETPPIDEQANSQDTLRETPRRVLGPQIPTQPHPDLVQRELSELGVKPSPKPSLDSLRAPAQRVVPEAQRGSVSQRVKARAAQRGVADNALDTNPDDPALRESQRLRAEALRKKLARIEAAKKKLAAQRAQQAKAQQAAEGVHSDAAAKNDEALRQMKAAAADKKAKLAAQLQQAKAKAAELKAKAAATDGGSGLSLEPREDDPVDVFGQNTPSPELRGNENGALDPARGGHSTDHFGHNPFGDAQPSAAPMGGVDQTYAPPPQQVPYPQHTNAPAPQYAPGPAPQGQAPAPAAYGANYAPAPGGNQPFPPVYENQQYPPNDALAAARAAAQMHEQGNVQQRHTSSFYDNGAMGNGDSNILNRMDRFPLVKSNQDPYASSGSKVLGAFQSMYELYGPKKIVTSMVLIAAFLMIFNKWGEFFNEGVAVDVTTVEQGEIFQSITVPGKVVSKLKVDLTPSIAGRLTNVYVEEGDTIKKGELLARLDDREAKSNLKRAEANFENAEEEVALAERSLKRLQQAFSKGAVARALVEDAEAELRSAKARVSVAGEEVGTAKLSLENPRIAAPFSGTVTARYVEVGQWVVPSETLFTLIDQGQREIEVQVDAADSAGIAVGQTVSLSSDAFPGLKWTESVSRLAAATSNVGNANTVSVFISLGGGAPSLRFGQQVDAEIRTAWNPNALKVPFGAVVKRQGRPHVAVLESDTIKMVEVETGIEDFSHVEIKQGLSVGQAVVLANGLEIKDGEKAFIATE